MYNAMILVIVILVLYKALYDLLFQADTIINLGINEYKNLNVLKVIL